MFLEQAPNNDSSFGWMEVICGSMFSGKTEELIRRLKRAELAQQKVAVFKPVMDQRYAQNNVVSHDSNEFKAVAVNNARELLTRAQGFEVIGLDEAQFFDDEIVPVCNTLANQGVRVIIAGLDMDFKGVPFGPMPALMATAEYVTKVHAICSKTGRLAQYSYRLDPNDDLVMLGETQEYQALSRAAFVQAMQERKTNVAEPSTGTTDSAEA
jgi:thymidine kinase